MTVFVNHSTLRPGQRPTMPGDETRAWLAGKSGEHIPTATAQTSMVVNRVIGLLEKSRAKTHFSTSEHFNRTVRLWEAVTRRAEMGEWLQFCEGLLLGLDPLAEALARLVQHATYSYEDALGLIYMALNLGDVRKGQYFTPFAIARMMAEMTLGDWQPPYGPAGPAASFYEPACGSGIMFLAIMEVLETRFPANFPALVKQGFIVFRGIDLDPTAVLMTTLNLSWRGYPLTAETISLGNALAMPAVPRESPPATPRKVTMALSPAPPDDPLIPAPDSSEQYRFF